MKKFLTVLATIPFLTACGPSNTIISGGGATFPSTLYNRWFNDYNQETGEKVNYQATGSGTGVRQFNAETIDFGASDESIPDSKIKAPVIQIPMTGGAIAVAFNNPGCAELWLTQEQLAGVFIGRYTNFNQIGCNSQPITVVHRSDGSGTTAGFTASLSSFDTEWKKKIGHGKSVQWPVGIGAKGNSGVAAVIKQNSGTIGYVNVGYTLNDQLKVASIQNSDGFYMEPYTTAAKTALDEIKLDDKLRGSNPNPEGTESYPIVSLTWILARPEHPNNESMKKLFRYMLSVPAQLKAGELGYVPLPDSIRFPALEAVESLK